MRAALAFVVIAVAACGDDASHVALPHVVSHGGRVLDELSLVTITYPDDPLADVARRFDDAVLRTRWLGAVGAEYGVHGGDHVASYTMPAAAPAHMTYGELAAIPGALLAAGAVPGPSHHGVPILYVIYLPATTHVTDDAGMNPLCVSGLAYHSWVNGVPYAIVPSCYPGAITARTMFASHELIEAATDPFGDGWYVDPDDARDPMHYAQPEVADLCNRVPAPPEAGFDLEASWSNAEADAWDVHPCQPVAPGDVYTTVFADPATVQSAAAGEAVHYTLTGWASGPTDAWPLFVKHGYAGDSGVVNDEFAATAALDAPTIAPGQEVGVTLTVPLDAPSGSLVAANVWSGTSWTLLAVRVR